MDREIEREIKFISDDFVARGNSVLFYGKPEHTLEVLRGVYERINEREEFLCSWHDASAIAHPMGFFEPVLRLKYGDEYESVSERIKDIVKNITLGNDRDSFSLGLLAELCGKEEKSKNSNARKMPVFFIDGIAEFLFRMDYGHLDEEGIERIFNYPSYTQTSPRGFGSCLRAELHQAKKGIFCGTVRNAKGLEHRTTLGNYYYLFYSGNFLCHTVWKDQEP